MGEIIGYMDTFSEALLSEKTDKIPEPFDWFAPLLGDWDCDYYDEYVKGEMTANTDHHFECLTKTKNGTMLFIPVPVP